MAALSLSHVPRSVCGAGAECSKCGFVSAEGMYYKCYSGQQCIMCKQCTLRECEVYVYTVPFIIPTLAASPEWIMAANERISVYERFMRSEALGP